MVLAWASLAAGNAGAEVQTRALTVAGAKRSYILFLPDSRTEFKGLPRCCTAAAAPPSR